jgi:hypothetical protein
MRIFFLKFHFISEILFEIIFFLKNINIFTNFVYFQTNLIYVKMIHPINSLNMYINTNQIYFWLQNKKHLLRKNQYFQFNFLFYLNFNNQFQIEIILGNFSCFKLHNKSSENKRFHSIIFNCLNCFRLINILIFQI